jgi:hypothetical protein
MLQALSSQPHKHGNCPHCGYPLQHFWLDYLGWTDDWYMKCTGCKTQFHTLEGEVDPILEAQPHIIISRS